MPCDFSSHLKAEFIPGSFLLFFAVQTPCVTTLISIEGKCLCLWARRFEGLDKPRQKPRVGTATSAGQHLRRQSAVRNVMCYQSLHLFPQTSNMASHLPGLCHTLIYRWACIHSVHVYTKWAQLRRTGRTEKIWGGLMGSYGRWQNTLHTQTNEVWQPPLRKTCGCFYPQPPFLFFLFITAWLTASAIYQTSIVYLCSAQSHLRWQAIRGEPLPFSFFSSFLPFFHTLSLVPFYHAFFSLKTWWISLKLTRCQAFSPGFTVL